jgi:AcrR family transcriptional regulator
VYFSVFDVRQMSTRARTPAGKPATRSGRPARAALSSPTAQSPGRATETSAPAPAGSKRARTRAALIDAAARLIGEKGYHNTTLEDVAAAAGMTRGAIYGNFKDRDELFLAVLEARWKPIVPQFKTGASLKEQMRILADAVIAGAPARRAVALRALEFQLYALTHPQMQARLARYSAEAYTIAERELLKYVPATALPMPAASFVRVLHALIDGLLFERFQSPAEITDELIRAAFEALASGPTRA